MINEIISMNGYGAYVWSAFAFTLISFTTLYFVTKLQLLKEQKKFASKFSLDPVQSCARRYRVQKYRSKFKQVLFGRKERSSLAS